MVKFTPILLVRSEQILNTMNIVHTCGLQVFISTVTFGSGPFGTILHQMLFWFFVLCFYFLVKISNQKQTNRQTNGKLTRVFFTELSVRMLSLYDLFSRTKASRNVHRNAVQHKAMLAQRINVTVCK